MAGENYIQEGTALLINGEASADVAWSMEGVTSGAGRVSAQLDLGAGPRPKRYSWICEWQTAGTPTQGKGIELYAAAAVEGDATRITGNVGQSDAALANVDVRRNLLPIDLVVAETATANKKFIASGVFEFEQRYLTMVGYNDSGATINSTDSNFKFYLTPIYDQVQ